MKTLLLVIALALAGCGKEPVEVDQGVDGAISIWVELTDTLVSYTMKDGQLLKVTSIRSGWKIANDTHWFTDRGLTLCIDLTPDTTSADTTCYDTGVCK